jgi:LPXTG-motif cell wall-anchored protein
MRTKLLAAAMSGGILLSAVLAVGMPGVSYADTTPAPPSDADASALRLDPLLRISHTHATAGPTGGGSSAKANVLEISGNPPVAQLGGTQTGVGSKSGSLLDTSTTPLGAVLDLKLLPWKALVSATPTHRHAEGYAAVATLVLMNTNTLYVKLLQSESKADHDDETLTSTSSASSDGLVVGLGGALTIDVLHAEASTANGGSSYILGINNNYIGTNSQAGSACALSVPGVLQLSCLSVTGGKGLNTTATDLTAVLGANTATAGISNVSSSTGKGATVQGQTTPTTSAPAPAPVVAAAQLPRTGASSLAIALFGLVLVALGAAVVFAARVRRRLPVA